MTNTIDLGRIASIRIRSSGEGLYLLTARTEGDDSAALLATEEALRSLWAHLTKLLYPRAGDQLTERIATVKRDKDDAPPEVAYSVTAHRNSPDGPIILSGVTRERVWSMQISTETGDDLWTTLEDMLDQV